MLVSSVDSVKRGTVYHLFPMDDVQNALTNLVLLIVFAAAGFIIVFFIATLNLTVTQGAINGLIIYSNVSVLK